MVMSMTGRHYSILLTLLDRLKNWLCFYHSIWFKQSCDSSLFAAINGAERTLAFEVSRPLCSVAASVVSAYNLESKIFLLNKMSTDYVAQLDDPK